MVPFLSVMTTEAELASIARESFLQFGFGPVAFGDVAEAPDPTNDLGTEPLRSRIALHDPSVLQQERGEILFFRVGVQILDAAEKGLRIHHPSRDGLKKHVVVARFHQLRLDVPNLQKTCVVGGDPLLQIDDEDAVRGRFDGGLQARGPFLDAARHGVEGCSQRANLVP